MRDNKSLLQLRPRPRKQSVHIYSKIHLPVLKNSDRMGKPPKATAFPSSVPQHCPGTQHELQHRVQAQTAALCSLIPSQSIIQFAWAAAVPPALQCCSSKHWEQLHRLNRAARICLQMHFRYFCGHCYANQRLGFPWKLCPPSGMCALGQQAALLQTAALFAAGRGWNAALWPQNILLCSVLTHCPFFTSKMSVAVAAASHTLTTAQAWPITPAHTFTPGVLHCQTQSCTSSATAFRAGLAG